MPIKIPSNLPAFKMLSDENIFVMDEERAFHQDIRSLRIAILNLMPTKIATEAQFIRLIGNSPLQVEMVLLHPETHTSKNISEEHLAAFYKTFKDVEGQKFDGLIITGAPVEQLDFEEVDYWEELTQIMDWSVKNVYSTMHICWGAQAGLYYHYGIQKYMLDHKIFGVFEHSINRKHVKLFHGFDDIFYVPHSRYTKIIKEDMEKVNDVEILSESSDAGVCIAAAKEGRQIFITGHFEYDPSTLKDEYDRDILRGIDINVPKNYFPGDDVSKTPIVRWRSHANLLFMNWLNYYVYQETPFDLGDLK